MKLMKIFKKPVDRAIEGVIKADDDTRIKLEVEEYVLTNEVAKQLENFLAGYNNYENSNGAWISGFFGSGKSHLLKILSLLLENQEIEGDKVLDLFLPKCGDNEILKADLKHAVDIPSKSVLFNIDQKADVISKTQIDALLAVFVKVFDEMSGYYGKQGHIAQFERDLDNRGIYSKFKDEYKTISGMDWFSGREEALLEGDNIAQAYANVAGTAVTLTEGILDKYRDEYKVSIEDFADKVNEYIKKQPANFRLNFFVDEVGQYIAENIKLMTNLQTVAESLATKCKGRAWIIVTAQEDMNTVVGEMDKQHSNDFTKIQARFSNKLKLTSQDVAEVIQKRLLAKDVNSIELLSDIYQQQSNNFKTLFDFEDGTQTYRNFNDRDHFIYSYPFIPYQFPLFQKSIENLSKHSAFEGRHSSVGERSMLGVFQQVAIHIADHELGQLATFDLMFEGIRTALRAQLQRSILIAEKNLENAFAIKVLKALFLVKYIREFKPTIRNICVLMYDRFDSDLPKLKTKVEEALNLLEQQTYIQRSANVYEYLTDEEKDVEQEIKNTDVESSAVLEEIQKIVFDGIISERKIRDEQYKQDYTYTKMLDDKTYSRSQELAIHLISPFHEHSENEKVLMMHSMGKDELTVIIPADDRLMRDMQIYKQTEKYIRQNTTTTQQDTRRKILSDKTHLNQERMAEINTHLRTLLSKAKLLVAGEEYEVGAEDPRTRITTGFLELIRRTYPNMRMLRGVIYKEDDIPGCLLPDDDMFASLSEAEQEELNFITGNNRNGVRTTLKGLIEQFEKKPYGWSRNAILCILAKLLSRGKIEAKADGNILENSDLLMALNNTTYQGNTVLTPQIDFTQAQIRRLKEFYEDFFDELPHSTEAKALGVDTSKAFKKILEDLNILADEIMNYPFSKELDKLIALVSEIAKKQYTFYLTDLSKQEDDLLDLKENILEPMREFVNSSQKALYDSAAKFIKDQEPNFSYIAGDEVEEIKTILADGNSYKGNSIQKAKSFVDAAKEKINQKLKEERTNAINTIDNKKTQLAAMKEFQSFPKEKQAELLQPFNSIINELKVQLLIAVIRDNLRRFEEIEYVRILTKLNGFNEPVKQPVQPGDKDEKKPEPLKQKYVSIKAIKVPFVKAWLENETEVDEYLKSLKEAIMKEIKNGNRLSD